MKDRMPVVSREEDSRAKRALLESALRLFVRDGVCETTIRAVAAKAGVTNPAIFKFFNGREDLAQCVFERCYERMVGVLAQANRQGRFEERVRALSRAATEFMAQELDAFLFVTEQLRRFWPRTRKGLRERSVVRELEALFELGVAEGKVSSDHDRKLMVAATIGLFAQVGRAFYFEELEGPAPVRAPELERLILRIGW